MFCLNLFSDKYKAIQLVAYGKDYDNLTNKEFQSDCQLVKRIHFNKTNHQIIIFIFQTFEITML